MDGRVTAPASRLPWRLRWRNWLRRKVRRWFQWRAPLNPPAAPDALTWQLARVAKLAGGFVPAHRLPPVLLRRAYRLTTLPFHVDARPVRTCRNLKLGPGLRVRIYTPASAGLSAASRHIGAAATAASVTSDKRYRF